MLQFPGIRCNVVERRPHIYLGLGLELCLCAQARHVLRPRVVMAALLECPKRHRWTNNTISRMLNPDPQAQH